MLLSLQSGFQPREERAPVLIPSRMRVGEGWVDVCIRNLSSQGALVAAAAPPEQGSSVELRRGGHVIRGRVMWRNDREFGIRADERIDIAALTREPRLARQLGGSEVERRASPRGAAAERSRRTSSAIQLGFVASVSLAFASFMAVEVQAVLAQPATTIQANL